MLPPSWKSELQRTVHEVNNEANAQNVRIGADISSGLASIRQQLEITNARQASGERRQRFFDILTNALLLATVLFTGLSWWVFSDQLTEMRQVYKPIKEQADAARETMIASTRAWLAPRDALFTKELGLEQP